MNASCGAQHARWLERALAEGPEALEPASLRELEACAHCAPELREVAALEGVLATAAAEEREDLASITPAQLEGQRAFVEQVHRTHMAPAAIRNRAHRNLRPVLWLAAAGVLAALYFGLRDGVPAVDPGRTTEPGINLSSKHPMAAQNLAAQFRSLRWEAGAQTASSWQVAASDLQGAELFSKPVYGNSLEVGSQETATWPERIVWTVTPRDMGGRLMPEGAVSAEVARSP